MLKIIKYFPLCVVVKLFIFHFYMCYYLPAFPDMIPGAGMLSEKKFKCYSQTISIHAIYVPGFPWMVG